MALLPHSIQAHRITNCQSSPVENLNANGRDGQLRKMQVRKQLTFLNIPKHSSQECCRDYVVPFLKKWF